MPSSLVLGLRTLFRGTAAPLPTFRATFSPGSRLVSYDSPSDPAAVDHLLGAIVASYGFHAQLVWESDTPEYRRHGDKRFGMVAQELAQDVARVPRGRGDPHGKRGACSATAGPLRLRPRRHGLQPREDVCHLAGQSAPGRPAAARQLRGGRRRADHGDHEGCVQGRGARGLALGNGGGRE